MLNNVILLMGCGIEAKSTVKVCAKAFVPDLQRKARNHAWVYSTDESPKK